MNDKELEMFKSQYADNTDVVMQIKDTIYKDLKVASFAIVNKYDEDNQIANVTMMPLIKGEHSKNVEVHCEYLVHKDDIVLIVFCDRNFLQNLKQAKKNSQLTPLNENSDLHSDKYGVVVPLKKGSEGGGITINDVKKYLEDNEYATETWVRHNTLSINDIPKPINEVNELPLAPSETIFYKIKEDILDPVPGFFQNVSQIHFNASLSIEEVKDVIKSANLSYQYTDVQGMQVGMSDITSFYVGLDDDNEYSFAIVKVDELDFYCIVNRSFINAIMTGQIEGQPNVVFSSSGSILSLFTSGMFSLEGWSNVTNFEFDERVNSGGVKNMYLNKVVYSSKLGEAERLYYSTDGVWDRIPLNNEIEEIVNKKIKPEDYLKTYYGNDEPFRDFGLKFITPDVSDIYDSYFIIEYSRNGNGSNELIGMYKDHLIISNTLYENESMIYMDRNGFSMSHNNIKIELTNDGAYLYNSTTQKTDEDKILTASTVKSVINKVYIESLFENGDEGSY